MTGATGFVGSALVYNLIVDHRRYVRAALRHNIANLPERTEPIYVGDISADTDWTSALLNVEVVIHTAARVHIMSDRSVDRFAAYRRVNVDGTLTLAKQSAELGVRRFIFISSIKVNGEKTLIGRPFQACDIAAPIDPYGISKFEAEVGLLEIGAKTGMEISIIRSPLVYGAGVKANFLSMIHWLYKGIPLPLGDIQNKRSFVALDNLVDLIIRCIDHPAAANQIFLVSDGEDLSTTELLRKLAFYLGKPARLFSVPRWVLDTGAMIFGQKEILQRLCSSLQIDIAKTCQLLNWSPPVSVDQALERTVEYFLKNIPSYQR